MNTTAPDLREGFSPENIERIYRGESALVDGKTPADVLTGRQFETITQLTSGLSYREITEETGLNPNTIRDRIHDGKGRLGVVHRNQLAGYFPLDAGHELLEDKGLENFWRATKRLGVLEALSVGLGYEQAVQAQGITYNTATAHVGNISRMWPGVRGALMAVVVANALRARHVQEAEAAPERMQPEDIGKLTLPRVAKLEYKRKIAGAYSLET